MPGDDFVQALNEYGRVLFIKLEFSRSVCVVQIENQVEGRVMSIRNFATDISTKGQRQKIVPILELGILNAFSAPKNVIQQSSIRKEIFTTITS